TTGIRSSSVRLIVDPHYITSWGHFSGHGFYTPEPASGEKKDSAIKPASAEKDAGAIRPVSATNPVVTGKPGIKSYRNPDQPHLIELLRIGKIPGAAKGAGTPAGGPAGQDPSKDPDSVLLVTSAVEFDSLPCVRALWSGENVLRKGNRSC